MAKPVVDVLSVVDTYDPEEPYRRPLESLGYAFDHRDDSHVLFKGAPPGMPFHVHVVDPHNRADNRVAVWRGSPLRAVALIRSAGIFPQARVQDEVSPAPVPEDGASHHTF
jgi:hypothetical protein